MTRTDAFAYFTLAAGAMLIFFGLLTVLAEVVEGWLRRLEHEGK